MKWAWVALSLSLVGVGPLAVAQPHRHRHHHLEKRVPGTKTVYMLNGTPVPLEVVENGIKDGTLVMVGGDKKETPSSTPAPSSTSATVTSTVSPTTTTLADIATSSSSASSSSTSTTASAEPTNKLEGSGGDGGERRGPDTKITGGHGVDREFPDGKIDCSKFPEEYGAVPIPWEGLGGWTGLQQVVYNKDGTAVDDIHTMTKGPCADGMMCSYACPSGYQKAQWPKIQGSKGQSIGGLACKKGKLYLTDGTPYKKLCVRGVGGVKVQNTLGKPVAVCRTDYPGTESMNIPATLDIESSNPYELTCPDQDFYKWKGQRTSAQYYVNPAGTPLEQACTWGKKGSEVGNFSPMVLGASYADGGMWLSIQNNAPTNTYSKLKFNVEVVGDNLSCQCKYENGKYYQDHEANDKGCTVRVNSGGATYRFY